MDEATKTKLQHANARIRNVIRDQLKMACPDLYADYRKIRYPGGDGTDTDATHAQSVVFLFDKAREIIAPHYVKTPAALDEVLASEDEMDDYVNEEEGEEGEDE